MAVIFECEIPHWWLDWPAHERCAWLLGTYDGSNALVTEMRPTRNYAADPRWDFLVRGSRRTMPNLIGVLHTHPGGGVSPSPTDLAAIPSDMLGIVWWKGEWCAYTKEGPTP
jgi:proteasome lid subunit RPN8/RPN11